MLAFLFQLSLAWELWGAGILGSVAISIGASYLSAAFIKKPDQKMPQRSNFPTQSSMKGAPLPIIKGTGRVAGNVLWVKDVGTWELAAGYYVPTRSFLIGICEGPAKVKRIWLGKRMLWDAAGTRKAHGVFLSDGDGSSAYHLGDPTSLYPDQYYELSGLTEEEFGDYPNMCCAWFYRRLCTIDGAIPEFTFEVEQKVPAPYFLGIDRGTQGNCLYKALPSGGLDTSWGDNGAWGHTSNYGGTTNIHDTYVLPDGRILVAHNQFWKDVYGKKMPSCAMLTPEGVLDTTWGDDGFYLVQDTDAEVYGSAISPVRLLRDNWGNFHLICFCNDGSTGMYHKFDANGKRLQARAWTESPRWLRNPHWADWLDDSRQVIIISGNLGNYPNISYISNMMAIEVFEDDDTVLYEDWGGGNVTYQAQAADGYAMVSNEYGHPTANTVHAYHFKIVSNGIICTHGYYTDPSKRTLTKIALDGKEWDRNWGSNGHIAVGWPFYGRGGSLVLGGNEDLFVLARSDGGSDEWLTKLDNTGTQIDRHIFVGGGYDTYHYLTGNGSDLVLGTTDLSPANEHVEIWSPGLVYRSGFDPQGGGSYMRHIKRATPEGPETDANPAHVIYDIVSHNRYGGRFDATKINITDLESYCYENNLLISLVLKERKPLEHWIDHILAHCNGYRLWSGDTLKLGAFRDQDPVGLPIVQSDLYPKGPGPKVSVTVRDRSETFNRVEIGWSNRQNMYDYSSEPAQDQVDQRVSEAQGLPAVRLSTNDLDGICRIEMARQIAWQKLYEGMYRFKMFSFKVGYKHMLMEVGDVKLLSDGHKIVNQKIRVLSIKEEQFGRVLNVDAVEDTSAMYPTISYASQEAWTPWQLFAGDSISITDAGSISVTPIKINEADGVGVTDSVTVVRV